LSDTFACGHGSSLGVRLLLGQLTAGTIEGPIRTADVAAFLGLDNRSYWQIRPANGEHERRRLGDPAYASLRAPIWSSPLV